MRNQKRCQGWFVPLVIVFLCHILVGCAPKVTTGAFTNTGGLDNQLQRGVSTKMDVQRVLGAPNGYGGAILSDRY